MRVIGIYNMLRQFDASADWREMLNPYLLDRTTQPGGAGAILLTMGDGDETHPLQSTSP